MKCSDLIRTKLMFLIAMAISLSNSLYAQNAVDRTTAHSANDLCSKATLLKTNLMSTFSTFSLANAEQFINTHRSVCEEPNELQRAVWFKTIMPSSGKLNVYLQSENEMPRITVFYGECENLKYLACDGSSNVNSKMLTIIAKQLIEQPVFIRVATANTLSKAFDIKVENPSIPSVSIKDFSVINSKKGNKCQWTSKSVNEAFQIHIQHSTDGVSFTNLSSEKGQNHSTHEQHYFIHERPQVGKNFYRLEITLDNEEKFLIDEQLVIVEHINKKIRINPK